MKYFQKDGTGFLYYNFGSLMRTIVYYMTMRNIKHEKA